MPTADGDAQESTLQMRLLGKPELRYDGALLALPSLKGQALFYYLVATGRPHGRTALAGLLWPEIPERNARTNLRVELTKLRRHLGDYLVTTRTEITFAPDSDHWIDLAQFEQAAARGDPAGMAGTIALYRGDFLAEFVIRGAPEFETWIVGEQARYRQIYVEMLFALMEDCRDQQKWERALDYARRILDLEPWREAAHRATMYLLAQMGRRSAALAHFQRCRQILAEELGVGPAPETEHLYRQIQAGPMPAQAQVATGHQPLSLAASPARLLNVPVIPTRFIGREAETQKVLDLLRSDECRLVTLAGLGGIGKSYLAIHLAQVLVQDLNQPAHPPSTGSFPDGIFFAQLESLPAIDLLPDAVAQVLGIGFQGENNPRYQLFSYLRSRRLLLILDNFEHLADGPTFVRELLDRAPGVTLLVTSRQPLHIKGEWRVRLHGLPIPPPHEDGEEIGRCAAVQLFLQTARRLDLGFTISGPAQQARRRAIVHICRLVGGMPLALEMAATWTTTLSCAQIVQEIEHDLGFLSLPKPHAPPRHRSLRVVFAHTERMLPPGLRLIFARLSGFRGGWTPDAASVVAGATPADLAHLLDRSLVWRNAEGRYEMHPRLHQFAAGILADLAVETDTERPTERDAVQSAHAAYYRAYLHAQLARTDATAAGHGIEASTEDRTAKIVGEIGNIRAAWDWSVSQASLDTVAGFAEDLWSFYTRRGWFVEAAAMVETICRRQDLTGVQRALWYRLLGEAYIRLGQYRSALEATAQSLALLADPLPHGRFGFARGIARRAFLEIGRQILPNRGLANRVLLPAYGSQGDRQEGSPIDIRRQELARAHNQLCRVALFVQDSWLGIYCNARALDHGLRLGPSPELAMACVSWSMLCSHFSPWLAVHYGDLADRFAALDTTMAAEVANRRAIVDLAMTNWDGLETRLRHARALAYSQRDWQTWGDAYVILAVAYYYQARFGESIALLRELEQNTRDHSSLTHQTLAVQVQAAVRLAQQQLQPAAECLDRMQDLLPYLADNPLVNVIALALRGLVYLDQDDIGRAEWIAGRLARRLQGEYIPTVFHLFSFACVAEVHLRLLAHTPAREQGMTAHRRHARDACRRLQTLARLFPLARPYAALYDGQYRWHTGQRGRARHLWQRGKQQAQRLQLPHVQDRLEALLALNLERASQADFSDR